MKKLYYSISEISELIDEEQHILRYWEKEFEQLKPRKNRGGKRVYSDKELGILKSIKKLLRDDKLSLKGAKEKLAIILSDDTYNLSVESQFEISNEEKNDKSSIELKTNSDSIVITNIDEAVRKETVNLLIDLLKYLKKN